jgi:hypothetical protein
MHRGFLWHVLFHRIIIAFFHLLAFIWNCLHVPANRLFKGVESSKVTCKFSSKLPSICDSTHLIKGRRLIEIEDCAYWS